MSTTHHPEALNLEEFRAKVTHAAREPLLARIAELEDVADMAIKHISELEAQLSAIGAGGVEPLRKPASQQAVQAAEGVPSQTVPVGYVALAALTSRTHADDYAKCFATETALLENYPAAKVIAVFDHAATQPAPQATQGLDAQTTRDAVIQHLTNAGVLEHDGCGVFIASGDASELIDACMTLPLSTHPTQQGLDAQNEWEGIHTMPTCDDLIWLYCQDTNTIDGPIAPDPSFEDYGWTHWAYANAPSTAHIDAAIAAQAKQGEQSNG